jgi:hypothetical protein
MQKYTRSILGNPSQQGKKTHPTFVIFFKRNTSTTKKNLAHKRVLTNPKRLASKRGAHFSQEDVLAEISKLTREI